MTCCQNEELKEQISEQEKLIGKLSYEKEEIEEEEANANKRNYKKKFCYSRKYA